MCYILSCFGWALDFLQRTITFILACILCCIISLGVIVAIAAGVAYGYNYSMAEFLTFTRQDTTVYMRRGQFYDKPDFDTDKDVLHPRRFGQDAGDTQMKPSMDYQELNTRRGDDKALPDSWGHLKDTRKYAELLTKFNSNPEIGDEIIQAEEELTRTSPASTAPPAVAIPPARRISIVPNPRMVSTTMMYNGATHILMRNFPPLATQRYSTQRYPEFKTEKYVEERGYESQDQYNTNNELYSDEEQQQRTKFFQLYSYRPTVPAAPPISVNKTIEKQLPVVTMRYWAASKVPMRTEPYTDYKEDIDEDNVVYKPI